MRGARLGRLILIVIREVCRKKSAATKKRAAKNLRHTCGTR